MEGQSCKSDAAGKSDEELAAYYWAYPVEAAGVIIRPSIGLVVGVGVYTNKNSRFDRSKGPNQRSILSIQWLANWKVQPLW